jgi:hypothetical protein
MTDPVIYITHPVTGELVGTDFADPDPLVSGEWLVPAHAYLDAPPEASPGEAVVRAEDGWRVVPDYRGTVYRTSTGLAERFDQLGPLPEGLTTQPRPSPAYAWQDGEWRLDEALADALREEQERQAWEEIRSERDRRTQEGGFHVGDHWFHSDTFSRSQQLGLVLMGASMPAIQWKTMAGEFVAMTPALAQQILTAGAESDLAIFSAAEQHRAAMLASPNPSAYDFSINWPPIYGE